MAPYPRTKSCDAIGSEMSVVVVISSCFLVIVFPLSDTSHTVACYLANNLINCRAEFVKRKFHGLRVKNNETIVPEAWMPTPDPRANRYLTTFHHRVRLIRFSRPPFDFRHAAMPSPFPRHFCLTTAFTHSAPTMFQARNHLHRICASTITASTVLIRRY